MAEDSDPPVAGAARERDDRRGLRHQRLRRPAHVRDVARQRLRVAPVPEEVERHRQIAAPRERERERLHELLRPRESMRDHHGRPAWRPRAPIDGRGRVADPDGFTRDARLEAVEHEAGEDDCGGGEREEGEIEGAPTGAAGSRRAAGVRMDARHAVYSA